jgi:peptide/nickel transport system substrate-binding protein
MMWILMIVGVALSGIGAASQQQGQQVIRIAIGLEPNTFVPARQDTTLVSCMLSYMLETLVYLTPEGKFEPLLATEWSISPDHLEYTFKIREGVKFHDGTPLNAEAVKFNLDKLLQPCPLCGFIGPLERVEVVDEYTVKLIYKKPFAPALLGLTWPVAAIGSPTAFQEMGEEKFSEHPVGTGPFKMEEWVHGARVVMVRNEDYWGKPAIPQRLEWIIAPEGGTRSAMVLAGDVDVAYQPPVVDIPRFQAAPNVDVISVPSTRIMFVGINTTKPPLDKKEIRHALNYAVDAEAIANKILLGAGTPDHAPLPSSFFGYHEIGFYDYNPSKAKELLAEAGYPNGFNVIFYHPTGRYILDTEVAQAIQSYLADVGVKAELRTMDWPTYVGSLRKPREESPFDLALLGWGPLPDAHHMYSMFHSSQQPPVSLNIAFYSNPEVDRLLDEASTEFDLDKRSELYRQAWQIIWDDAPWIFLYTQNMVLAVNAKLKGLFTYPWEMFNVVYAYKED